MKARISAIAGSCAASGCTALKPFGENAGAVKQLLIERRAPSRAVPGELAALHADDVESLEARILAVDEPKRNDVAAHAANAADHHLRTDPRELMHRRQPADEDEIADFAVAAERAEVAKITSLPTWQS